MNLLLSLGERAFDWTWKTSVCAALLTVLVFLAQRLLGKSLTPRFRYLLSLLILIRLLLPMVPASSLSLENLLPQAARVAPPPGGISLSPVRVAAGAARDHAANFSPASPAVPSLPAPRRSMTWTGVFCLVWISGGSGLALLAAWRHRKWSGWIKAGKTIDEPRLLALLDRARGVMGVRQPVTAVAVARAAGPAVFGIWSARVLLPRSILNRLTDDELRLVLLHEMAHIRRKDAWLNAVLMAVQFIHWFNPLVWLACHRIRADRELVCDEMVMRHTKPEERANYGRLLLKLIDEFPTGDRFLPTVAAAVGDKHEIKQRIIMIKNHGKKRMTGSVLTVIAMALLTGGTFTSAQTSSFAVADNAADKTAATAATPVNASDLAGIWILVGKPGDVHEAPATGGRFKFFTGTHWCITQADPKTGVVIFHHGGTYTLKQDKYLETLDYANKSTKELIGHTLKFTLKVEGDTLTQTGIDNPWTEVWKRVK